jgi:hypothetical protein
MSYPAIPYVNNKTNYTTFTKSIFTVNDNVLTKIKEDKNMFSNLYTFINNNITIFYSSANHFYKLSCFIFTLPWTAYNYYRYTSTNNGFLIANSANCKFTIAKLDNTQNGTSEELFIKVVSLHRQGNDFILIDIISAIIFETFYNYIRNESSNRTPNIIDNYQLIDFVNIYKYAFSSYSTPTHWDYNKLVLEKYSFPPATSGNNYDNFCNIYITNAINGTPVMIYDLIVKKFAQNNTNIAIRQSIDKYFRSIPHLYNFIYYYGYHFGFVHNDLHCGNMLYDEYLDRLTMIDYGRNYFGFFYDNYDFDIISNCITNYYKILNYDNLRIPQINNYKEMIDILGYQNGLKSIIKTDDNNGYLTHILDIMTISITFYYYLYLIKIIDKNYNKKLKQIIDLIYLSYNENDKSKSKYQHFLERKISINLRDTNILKTYINTKYAMYLKIIANPTDEDNIYFTYIYDGLFFIALMFIYFDIKSDFLYDNSNGTSKLFRSAFQILKTNSLVTQDSINNFMKYLKVIHKKYPILAKINTYFKKMDPQIISGGAANNVKSRSKSKSSSKSSLKSKSKRDLNYELKELALGVKNNTISSLQDIEPNHDYDIDINNQEMINMIMINPPISRNPKMKEEENIETKMKEYANIFQHNMQMRELNE